MMRRELVMEAEFSTDRYFDPETSGIIQLPVTAPSIFELIAAIPTMLAELAPYRQVLAPVPGSFVSDECVYISPTARVEPGVCIIGPAYIGPNVVLRNGAYIRENVIMMDGSLLGHACEAKGSIFLHQAHAPHFSYVGDSILGAGVNLGAGTILSNLPITSQRNPLTGKRNTIKVSIDGNADVDTHLAKLGAVLGDGVQTGCNAVLNPGTIVGPHTWIYPNATVPKGVYAARSIIKHRSRIETVAQRIS
jgi:NDP-sugar pyrophosphorylase family protein